MGDCEFKDGLTKSQILRGQVIKGKPISVVSRGQGDQIRYGLISSSVGAVVPRVWNEDHSGADLSQLEGTLRPFMTRNGIRFAQLALYSRGTEIARSSYSWTEPDRTDIKDLGNSGQFLLAGQSRSFVGAVVQAIIDDGIITLDSPAYGLISGLPTPADFRADQITIGQLLNSTSGYGESTHPENIMRSISSAVGNLRTSSVLERLGYVSYVYSRVKLDYDPGTRVYDSNYNWDLLAEICQKVTGTGFYSFLRDRVLDPEKLNVTQFATIPGGNAQDPETATGGNQSEQVVLEDDHLGPSAYNLLNNRLVPYTQSGNGMILEVSIGSTGLAGNAASVAKFLGSNALAGAGPRIGGVSRLSTVAGALSYAESRRDGKDWCLLMNSQNFKGDADPQSQLVDPINDFFTGVNTNVATT